MKREQAGFLFVSLHDAEHAPKKKLISPPAPFASPYRYTMYYYHIYKWISDCVVERYKALDKEEAKEYKERISTLAGLKEEGKRFLAMSVTSNVLLDVIMDTINWSDFMAIACDMGINKWFYEEDEDEEISEEKARDAVATVRRYISILEPPMKSMAEEDAITLLANKGWLIKISPFGFNVQFSKKCPY